MTALPNKKYPTPLLILLTGIAILGVFFPSFSVAKTVHLVALISWFAGLFYLPRLFVYHAESTSTEVARTLTVMQWKLFYYIMNPAAVITIFSGVWMIATWGWVFPVWLHMKLGLVLLLLGFHICCWHFVQVFRLNQNQRDGRFFRILNEIPTVLLILIVYLVVFKPFG